MPTLNLNTDAIRRANDASQFDAGNVIARDAEATYADGLKKLEKLRERCTTEEQRAYLDGRLADWAELCTAAGNDSLSRRASWVPWNVCGPANYPAARMQRRQEAAMKAAGEWAEKQDRFLANTADALKALEPFEERLERIRSGESREEIASDDPHAEELLAARIAHLEETQDWMKRFNAWSRAHRSCQNLREACPDAPDVLRRYGESHMTSHGVPFPSWALSNNNANIHRLRGRLEGIRKLREAAAAPKAARAFDGGRLEECPEDCRIRFFFDAKPDEPTRDLLKGSGFVWSPRAGAWQRMLNDNGRRAAHRVLEKLAPAAEQPAETLQPVTLSLDEFAARLAAE